MNYPEFNEPTAEGIAELREWITQQLSADEARVDEMRARAFVDRDAVVMAMAMPVPFDATPEQKAKAVPKHVNIGPSMMAARLDGRIGELTEIWDALSKKKYGYVAAAMEELKRLDEGHRTYFSHVEGWI